MKFTHPKLGVLSLTKVNNNHCTVSLKTTTLTQTAFPCQSGATIGPRQRFPVSQSVRAFHFPFLPGGSPCLSLTRAERPTVSCSRPADLSQLGLYQGSPANFSLPVFPVPSPACPGARHSLAELL